MAPKGTSNNTHYIPDAATRQFEKDWSALVAKLPCYKCNKPLGNGPFFLKDFKKYHSYECE